MLEWNPQKRATAQQMLSHPWLNMAPNYDTKMKEKEYQHMTIMKKLQGEDEEIAIDNTVMWDSIDEQCYAGCEDNDKEETSEDDIIDQEELSNNKYGPNSPLLNIDHGENPQFINADNDS